VSDILAASRLLDPTVIDDPYPFYSELRERAPVWQVPDTQVFVVSSFALVAEATSRVEDFSSNMHCLLYRDPNGIPMRLPFGDSGVQTLATADPPTHGIHRSAVFPELVARRMEALEPEITALAQDLVDAG
jgi:cytochrome P450